VKFFASGILFVCHTIKAAWSPLMSGAEHLSAMYASLVAAFSTVSCCSQLAAICRITLCRTNVDGLVRAANRAPRGPGESRAPQAFTCKISLKTNPKRLKTNPKRLKTNPKRLKTNPKRLKTNPKRLKTNLKRLKTNPKRLKTNPKRLVPTRKRLKYPQKHKDYCQPLF